MAHLIISSITGEIARFNLDPKETYTIGRESSCEILLKTSNGISRQHASLAFKDNQWTVTLLSKYGTLIFHDEAVAECALNDRDEFSIPPYNLQLVLEEAADEITQHDVDAIEPLTDFSEMDQVNSDQTATFSPVQNQDEGATQIVTSSEEVLISITAGEDQYNYTLTEGEKWVIGRGQRAHILLNNKKVSRTHAVIQKTGTSYYLQQVSSRNLASVNGQPVQPGSKVELLSGQSIQILETTLEFQIRNKFYKDIISEIKKSDLLPSTEVLNSEEVIVTEYKEPKNKKIISLITGTLVIIVLVAIFGGTNKKKSIDPSDNPLLAKYGAEQLKILNEHYGNIVNYYTSHRFELCLSEIETVHAISQSTFKRSGEFEKHCHRGIELRKQEEDQKRLEAEQKEIREKIKTVTSSCKKKLDQFNTMLQINECLAPALILDPQHPMIVSLIKVVEKRVQDARVAEENQKENRRLAQLGFALYAKAKKVAEKNNPRKTIAAYEKYIKSKYPGQQSRKAEARKFVKELKEELANHLQGLLDACNTLYEQGEYKKAIPTCNKVLVFQKGEAKAIEYKKRSLASLKRKVKDLYIEAAIEEGMANIDVSKKLWQKIIDQDSPEGDYYKKAKTKLKKYGILTD